MNNTHNVRSRDPEEWVITEACRGDEAAFDELITRHRTRALQIACFYCRDTTLAPGIAREAFTRTLLSTYKLPTPARFLAHLVRTIRSISAKTCPLPASDEIPVPHLPPDIRAILDNMPRRLSDVLFLKDMCGLNYSTLAAVNHIPKFIVAFRVTAARKLFARYSAEYAAADEEV